MLLRDNWRWIVGQNYLGRQVIVYRNGKVSLNFEAFWVYTGSYFNARYYYSGIAAYGGRNYTAREWMNISATNVGGNISDYTGVSGTVASSTAGVAGMTKASAQLSEQTQFKYGKRVNGTIKGAKTLSQENAIVMGKIAKGARFAGNALGVVSLVDHSAQAYDAFNQDDYINGWINVGKASIDVGLMFIKSNPFVLGISVVYNISDAAGLLEY